ESTFGIDTIRSINIMQSHQQINHTLIVTATLNADSALATGRQRLLWFQITGDALFQLQAQQASRGQHNGIKFTSIQFPQTRTHIATQGTDFQVRAMLQQLTLTTQAGSTNMSPPGQLIYIFVLIGNKCITRVFSWAY